MKLGVLFSGGKDSTLAAWIAKKEGYELRCLISVFSENKESFMFHTPSIEGVRVQAEAAGLPLVVQKTAGEKEGELGDLRRALKRARDEFGIEGVLTGAVASVYQASRIQKICLELGLWCFNPLWQKNQLEILRELVEENFEVVVVGVFAYPFGKSFLGRRIDKDFILEMDSLSKKYRINPAGEGGEFESFVLNCPLFEKPLRVVSFEDFGEGNSWRRELFLGFGEKA